VGGGGGLHVDGWGWLEGGWRLVAVLRVRAVQLRNEKARGLPSSRRSHTATVELMTALCAFVSLNTD